MQYLYDASKCRLKKVSIFWLKKVPIFMITKGKDLCKSRKYNEISFLFI